MNSEQLELMSQLWEKMEQATIYDRILGYLNQGAKMYPANMFYLIADVLNTRMTSIVVTIGSHEFEFWDLDSWFKGWSPKWSKNNLFNSLAKWIWDKGVQEKFQTHKTITANLVVTELIKIINDNELAFNLVKLKELNGRSSASGYGTCPIQIKFSNKEPFIFDEIHN